MSLDQKKSRIERLTGGSITGSGTVPVGRPAVDGPPSPTASTSSYPSQHSQGSDVRATATTENKYRRQLVAQNEDGRPRQLLSRGDGRSKNKNVSIARSVAFVQHERRQHDGGEGPSSPSSLEVKPTAGGGVNKRGVSLAGEPTVVLPDPFPPSLQPKSSAITETHETCRLLQRHNVTIGNMRNYVHQYGTASDYYHMLTAEQRANLVLSTDDSCEPSSAGASVTASPAGRGQTLSVVSSGRPEAHVVSPLARSLSSSQEQQREALSTSMRSMDDSLAGTPAASSLTHKRKGKPIPQHDGSTTPLQRKAQVRASSTHVTTPPSLPWIGTAPPIISVQSRVACQEELLETSPKRTIAEAQYDSQLPSTAGKAREKHKKFEQKHATDGSVRSPVDRCAFTPGPRLGRKGNEKADDTEEEHLKQYAANDMRYTDIQGNIHVKDFKKIPPNLFAKQAMLLRQQSDALHHQEVVVPDASAADTLSDGFGTLQLGRCDSIPLMRAKFDEWRTKFASTTVPMFHWVPLLESLVAQATAPEKGDRLDVEMPDVLKKPTARRSATPSSKTTFNTELPSGGPNPLRVAAAMFAVRTVFQHLKLPLSFVEDIEHSLYTDGAAKVNATHADQSHLQQHNPSSSPGGEGHSLSMETNYIERTLYYTALKRKTEAMKVLAERTEEVMQDVRRVERELGESRKQRRVMNLRFHFGLWRTVVFQQGAWKHCAATYSNHKVDFRVKMKAFRGWRSYLMMKHLDDRVEEAEGNMTLLKDDFKDQLRTMQRQAQEQIELEEKLRESKAKESKGKLGYMTKDEQDKLIQEAEKASSLEGEVASLTRRCRDLEGKTKHAIMERERAKDSACMAAEAVRETLGSLIGGRLFTGIKAIDVLVNAEKMSTGALTQFHRTTVTGIDNVVGPIKTKGDHILLAWANAIVEAATGAFPRIAHISHGMNDGAHYATLMDAIFPEHNVGGLMSEQRDSLSRLNILVNEGSHVLGQRLVSIKKPAGMQGAADASSPSLRIPVANGAHRRHSSVAKPTGSSSDATQRLEPGPLLEAGITRSWLTVEKMPTFWCCLRCSNATPLAFASNLWKKAN